MSSPASPNGQPAQADNVPNSTGEEDRASVDERQRSAYTAIRGWMSGSEFITGGIHRADAGGTHTRDGRNGHEKGNWIGGKGKLYTGLDRLPSPIRRHLGKVREKGDKRTGDDQRGLYPEVDWDAELRRTNDLHEDEIKYVSLRRQRIAVTGALKRFLDLPEDEEVNPDDVPIIGLGGSGGGYRSHLAFIATFQEAKELGFWDLICYMAGVSAACWTIAGYLTFADRNADTLLEHFVQNAGTHPISLAALRAVMGSPGGSTFLLRPLAIKVRKGFNITLMDFWSTLSTAYMWLPVQGGEEAEGEKPKLREEWFQWSKVWERAGISNAEEPFPIITTVRHVVPWDPHTIRRLLRYAFRFLRPPQKRAAIEEENEAHHAWYQWFESNPLETGSDELEGWIPTWALGRKFKNGKSEERGPEMSLSMFVGPATSAPSAPLVDQLATVGRHLPENVVGSGIKRLGAHIIRTLPAEAERFGNKHPLHAGKIPNPFYLSPKKSPLAQGQGHDHTPRIQLMDAGLDNNMPMQPFLHPGRDVDVLINCDFSSDVQDSTAMIRLKKFCEGRGLQLVDRAELPPVGGVPRNEEGEPTVLTAEQVAERFEGRYGQILDGVPTYREGQPPAPREYYYCHPGMHPHPIMCNERDQPQARRALILVYMPLFPNKVAPDYDPSTASFSDSYNLIWTEEQVRTIAKTQRANVREALGSIKTAIREAYETRKRERLGKSQE